MVWMVWVFGFPVVSTATVALRGARWNRHRHRRRFSSGPRCAPVAPRTRLGGPVVVRGHPRRQRAPAPRVRCSRQAHPTGGFPLRLSPAVCLVWMVSVHLISVVSTAIHARGNARNNRKKNIDGRLRFCETCSSSVSRGAGIPRFKTLSRIRMGIVFLQA